MSTDKSGSAQKLTPVESPLGMQDLAAVLVKHYGLHDGCFDLIVEFQVGVGPVGPQTGPRMPGAMVGVSRIGLVPAEKSGPTTVDAAVTNPQKKVSRRKAA